MKKILILFFPINDIIEEVFDFLNGGSGIALMGETGSGKSSLLKVIKSQTYTLLNNKRKPIILDLGQISNNQEYYKLLCELCEIDPPVEGYEFVKSLKAIKKEKYGFLLLIDNVEQMIWDGFTYDLRNQLRSLANDVDPPLQLVIATNQSLTQLFQDSGKDSPFEGICLNVEVPCGDEDTMKRFIETRLAKTSVKFTENEIHNLMQKSKGNPRKLMQLCYTQFLHHSKIPHRNEFRRS